MPNVSFERLRKGNKYSREELASIWNYNGTQGLQRGVVTPAGHRCILLFATGEKQTGYQPYRNEIRDGRFYWDGPTDHYAETRLLRSRETGEQIHLFYRDRHHSDFEYMGLLHLEDVRQTTTASSKFTFRFAA